MTLRVRADVDDSDSLLAGYGALALVHLERAATEAGPWTEIGEQVIVAGRDRYTFWDEDGLATSWYRSFISDAADFNRSAYSEPFTVTASSITTISQVRALAKTSLTDDDLQEVIDREEAILAGEIGALSGSRIEVIRITEVNVGDAIRLRRQTNAVTVTEANAAVTDVRLGADGRTLTRLTLTGWSTVDWIGVVEATYSPSDQAKVVGWVIELVRSRLQETGYESESIGDYSYSRGQRRSHADVVTAAKRDILGRSPGLASVRLTTDLSPVPAWIGSVRP